jgi:hypothetical protein
MSCMPSVYRILPAAEICWKEIKAHETLRSIAPDKQSR